MSRKRCIRKHYALVNPISHAIQGASITNDAALNKLRLMELSALESFHTGAATADDWRTCADFLNVQETLCDMGVGPEAREPNELAQRALGAVQERSRDHGGRLVLTGPELQALREAYEFMDAQRTAIPRSQLEQAIRRTANRIRGAAPNVKVFM